MFELSIIDDGNLLSPVQCCKSVLYLLIHSATSKSVPVMTGNIGFHLTVVLIMHTGDGLTVQNGKIGIHTDGTKLPVLHKGIRENIINMSELKFV